LRAARPDDAAALAVLMEMADRAHYPASGYAVSLGGTREFQLGALARLACATSRSGFHYSHFEVAEDEAGNVVASVAGFERPEADQLVIAALAETGWTEEASAGLFERISGLGGCFPPDQPGTWTIEHVAVLPEFRGRGLAGALLARVLERGSALHFRHASVDVFQGNTAARHTYLKAGFQSVCTFGQAEFERILNRNALERLTRVAGEPARSSVAENLF
jgi:ribosomal protein S18 acetylase RimI-like enzyme